MTSILGPTKTTGLCLEDHYQWDGDWESHQGGRIVEQGHVLVCVKCRNCFKNKKKHASKTCKEKKRLVFWRVSQYLCLKILVKLHHVPRRYPQQTSWKVEHEECYFAPKMEGSYYLQGEFLPTCAILEMENAVGRIFGGFSKASPEKSWCTDVASSMKISQHGNLIEVDCNSSLDRLGHLVRCGKECCMVSPSPGPGVGGSVFQKDCWLQLICFGRFGYCPVLLIYSSIQFEPRVPLSFFWGRRYFFQLEALATKAVYICI